jgi:hypothetical protein
VRRSVRDRHADRGQARRLAFQVGLPDGRRHDAVADVVLVATSAGWRCERRVAGAGLVACREVGGELVDEARGHIDLAHAGVGLAVADVDLAVRKVDVERGRLADARPATAEHGDQGSSAVVEDR